MTKNITKMGRMVAVFASVACLAAPAFAQSTDQSTSQTTSETPAQEQAEHHGHGGKHGHHRGGLFMICVGQNLPAGTPLPAFQKGQKEDNMKAMKTFFTSDAFKTAAGKCTQYRPKWGKKGESSS